jgi:hypothetical protein
MSNVAPEAGDTLAATSISRIRLGLVGGQGWHGRERVAGDVADIVILRPVDSDARTAPAASLVKLAQAMHNANQLKPVAVSAIHEARRTFMPPPYDGRKWSLVEVRIDRTGRAWLGLYESNGDHEIAMVEFDEAWAPCSVWAKGSLDKKDIVEKGHRLA